MQLAWWDWALSHRLSRSAWEFLPGFVWCLVPGDEVVGMCLKREGEGRERADGRRRQWQQRSVVGACEK